MSQELQTSGQYATLSLWGSSIHFDKKVVQLKEFSAFLEQRAKKSAADFLTIGQQQRLGWLVVGADFLEKEMRQVCSEVGEYITANNILNNPNWELFLQPRILFAEASKQLILNLHETLIQACINNTEEQAQQAYRTSLANSEGLGFGIISNSMTAHFLYAMQAAQKERENEQAAQDAANRVRRNSSPVEKAGELTTKIYHETHEPFVLDSLAQFYGEVESFIYTGADYDKAALDAASKEATDIIAVADVENMKSAIVHALQKDVCCGEAVYAAIRNGLVDDNFAQFCEYAPIKLLINSIQPIVGWQKKEKLTNQLYNRPIFSQKTLRDFKVAQLLLLSGNKSKIALYNEILGEVYADEINSAFYALNELLCFERTALERYASEGKHFVISDSLLDVSVLLCNELHCSRLIDMLSGSELLLPLTREQLSDRMIAANAIIDVRHAEILKARKEKAARDAAEKAEKDRLEAEARAQKQAEKERKRQRNTKIARIAAIILTPAIIGILLWNYWLLPNVIQPSRAYSEAEKLLADGYYSDAATAFEALGDYKDSPAQLEEVVTYMMDDIYEYGIQLLQGGNYESAIEQFEVIVSYKDASEKIEEAKAAILENTYLEAEKMLESGLYEDSIQAFTKILNYRDSQNRITEAKELWNESIYNQACQLADNGDSISAAMMFGGIPDYSDASKRSLELWNQFAQRNTIYEGDTTLAITSDGCVLAAAYNSRGEHNVQSWRNIVDVAAAWHVSFGLTADGEVLSTSKDWGDFSTGEWKNIVDIEGGQDSIIGLKADGTVVAQGDNEWGECNVSQWTDVVSIKSNGLTTVGLRKDGTILICGNKADEFGECLNWTGIIQIATDGQHLVGLKADGTVMTVGNNEYGQCDLTRWHDVVFIDAGSFFTIGLQSDGTVLYAGLDKYGGSESTEWKGIIGIEAGNHVCIGLMPDGTLVIVGDDSCELFDEIRTWEDIRLPT